MKRWDPPDQGSKTTFTKLKKAVQAVEKCFKLESTCERTDNQVMD